MNNINETIALLEGSREVHCGIVATIDNEIARLKEKQAQEPVLERWKQIDFSKEPLTTREIARRKLEWLASELNKEKKGTFGIVSYSGISSSRNNEWKVEHIMPAFRTITDILFHTAPDAQYALSQMTQEELEALR